MIRRCEILAVPGDVATAVNINALELVLTETLDRPAPRRIAVGPWLVLVAGDGVIIGGPDDALVLTEGSWPDPVSLRLLIEDQSWALQSDTLGARPIYFSDTAPVVSTRPDLVAALTEPRLDPVGCAEFLQFGFTLADRTVFRGVRRLQPNATARGRSDGALRVLDGALRTQFNPPSMHEEWPRRTAAIIDRASKRGDIAMELSGGVDSRLVLAIARKYDVMPQLAMTLGAEDDEEVTLARTLCAMCRLPHVAIEPRIDADHAVTDAHAFVARAGYAVPAGPVAWMPRTFAALSPHRDAQLGGGGGECATGFYYSPFDMLLHSHAGRRAWIERRLSRQDVTLTDLFGHDDGRALHEAIVDCGARMLSQQQGSVRSRTDGVYETQRVPNAGGPILSACSAWYQPIQPLLSRPHMAWARTLPSRDRAGRRAQLRLLHELDPELAAIPFSHARRFRPSIPGQLATKLSTMRRTAGRTARRLRSRGGTPELAACRAIESIMIDESARTTLHRLAGAHELPLTASAVEVMERAPARSAHAIGALLTIGWGQDAALRIRHEITRSAAEKKDRQRAA